MAYTFDEPKIGLLQIANTDPGISTAGGTTIPTPPASLGMICRAFDPTYGEGEFILLVGVASTVIGSVVTYSPTTSQTALSPNTANQSQPVAIAMSANLAASYGWYQISGLAVVKKTAVAVTPGPVKMYQSATAGRLMPTSAAGKNVLGCAAANLATVASTVSTVVVSINRPHFQGPIT
jgi:hypothetical protein